MRLRAEAVNSASMHNPHHAHDHSATPHGHAPHVSHEFTHGSRKRPGIYLISPAGAVTQPQRIDRARLNLKSLGFNTALDRTALARDERFAGTDAQRLAAFGRAIRQPMPVVMATRGGYGLSRILHRLDYSDIANSGKIFVGHSDFTAFSLALLARTGAVSYAGPMAVYDFGGKRVNSLTADVFREVLRGELEILSFEAPDSDAVDCRGVLWGGNLALVTALIGTPYLPKTRGILFLEDINEQPYRIERMLLQLLHAGVLAKQKALLLGRFTESKTTAHDGGYGLHSIVSWIRREAKIPVITGLPFGHIPAKATLPVGAKVGLATDAGMAYLVLHDH